jgi:hypothetical protein
MANFDPNQLAGNIFGIAGMGIGLGLLAGVSRNVIRSTEDMYRPRPKASRDVYNRKRYVDRNRQFRARIREPVHQRHYRNRYWSSPAMPSINVNPIRLRRTHFRF